MAEIATRTLSPVASGIACGVAASMCWATAFAFAKQGIANGMAPADLALHRFVWTGMVMLPFLAQRGLSDLAVSAGAAAL